MSNSKIRHKNELCEGCLTKGRKLVPIQQYLRVYQKLMEDFMCKESLEKIIDSQIPKMCWECCSLLRNAQTFQQRAKQAHELLNKRTNSYKTMTHLSTLTTITIDTPDYEISYDNKGRSKSTKITTQKLNDEVKHEDSQDIKVELENEVDVKDETEFDSVKLEDYSDTEFINEDVFVAETEEDVAESLDAPVKEETGKIKGNKYSIAKKSAMNKKFKLIGYDRKHCKKSRMFMKVEVDNEERLRCLERFRHREKYIKAIYKCESCATGYYREGKYQAHIKKYHAASNRYVCNVCDIRMSSKRDLSKHIEEHKYKIVCLFCDYECLKEPQYYYHMVYTHKRCVECRVCGFQLLYKEFYKHYNSLHKTFVCDYCGMKTTKKERLINHIRTKHSENICKFCGRRYEKYHSMTRHIQLRHIKESSEESFCVECNIQFDNINQYRYHLKSSVKHRPKKSYPCPECNKVYARPIGMKNHYKYVHLQKTSFYCDQCSRYFLNGFRLRTHIASYHNKIHPPKNKMCTYCGRGFETNRILENHIRTHTGERPFACEHCSATFAQKAALVSHSRSIHKVLLRYSEAQ